MRKKQLKNSIFFKKSLCSGLQFHLRTLLAQDAPYFIKLVTNAIASLTSFSLHAVDHQTQAVV